MVVGDPGRLRQVITNLVGNAVKFTENGDVVLATEEANRGDGMVEVTFSVRDTGIGIPEDRLHAIFEEFEQVDTSMTRTYGGTGLGLPISQRLVAAMGGQLEVESEVGVGTRFWFTVTFPVAPEGRRARGRIPTEGLEGRRILIVDDSAVARAISRDPLERAGAVAEEAADADAGLAMLVEAAAGGHPFDAAIIDAMMPNKDGFQLARAVQDDPRISATRLLMLTSAADPEGSAKAREAGIKGYLTKPVARADLLHTLRALLGLRGVDEPVERRLVTQESLDQQRRVMRILLAEDERVNQTVAVGLLERRGHRVDVANNGREALEMAQEGEYDIILMDLRMPEMDGLTATRKIRALGGVHDDLPIVALTAHAGAEERSKATEAGMSGYLTKPFRTEELYGIVEGWWSPAASIEPDVPAS